jgi:molecular chaperone DnaK
VAYRLGVDLGTTYTAAALNLDGRVEMLSLGNRATQVASVLYVKVDGTTLIGEPAEHRGAADPTRLAREFKRRIGGVVPIIIGGSPYSPQALLAKVLGWVVEVATQQQGEPPEHVCVTYPANWGPFKHEILEQVLKLAGLRGASTCTEPEAAAIAYASRDRVPEGAKLAVYDLGGGTFDAAVLVRDGIGFRLIGNPDGVEHLGGIDFDAAVLQHVLNHLGPAVQQLDDSDPATLLSLNRLRRDCVTAKEALSSDDDTVVPVALPGLSTFVPLTRAQFEEMVRPAIGETVSAMQRALSSAGVSPEELHAIVMVGGSSRIPLVARELATAFGRPLARDNHPKHDVALGAAIRALEPVHPAVPRTAPVAGGGGHPAAGPVSAAPVSATPAHPPASDRPAPPQRAAQPAASMLAGAPPMDRPRYEPNPAPAFPAVPDQPSWPVPGAPPGWGGSAPGAPPDAAGWPGAGAGWSGNDGGGAYPPRPDSYRPDPSRGGASGSPQRARGPRRLVAIGAIGAVVVLAVVLGIAVLPGVLDRASSGSSTPTPTPTSGSTPVPGGLPTSVQPLADDVIVWPYFRNGSFDISTVTSDGRTGPPLAASPEEDGVPLVSPDRRTIFYLHVTAPGVRELRVMGADGSGDRPLFDPVPEGCGNVQRPAFGVVPEPQLVLPCVDPGTADVTLKLVKPDGTVVRDIDRGWLSDPALSPDGKFVVYWQDNATRSDGGAIYQTPTDGSGPPTQITPGGRVRDNDASVSPKGDLVAITRGGQGIWTVGVNTGSEHPLTQLTKEPADMDPTWSPDGSQIAFYRGGQVWVMNADGSGPRRVSPADVEASVPAWGPR